MLCYWKYINPSIFSIFWSRGTEEKRNIFFLLYSVCLLFSKLFHTPCCSASLTQPLRGSLNESLKETVITRRKWRLTFIYWLKSWGTAETHPPLEAAVDTVLVRALLRSQHNTFWSLRLHISSRLVPLSVENPTIFDYVDVFFREAGYHNI